MTEEGNDTSEFEIFVQQTGPLVCYAAFNLLIGLTGGTLNGKTA